MFRRKFLAITAGVPAGFAGCADEQAGEGADDTGGTIEPAVFLEYTLMADKEPAVIPEDIRKSRDVGGWRRKDYKWVVVQFEVTAGDLDMSELWFRSRVETPDRLYELSHASDKLPDGVQSRGTIKEGGTGIALYQIPEDVIEYMWNLERVRQRIHATPKNS